MEQERPKTTQSSHRRRKFYTTTLACDYLTHSMKATLTLKIMQVIYRTINFTLKQKN